MQKRQCPNGHIYDPSIYGDQCPLCPSGNQPAGTAGTSPATHLGNGGAAAPAASGHTQVATGQPAFGGQPMAGMSAGGLRPTAQPDASGATMYRPHEAEPAGAARAGHTMIRRTPSAQGRPAQVQGRRLVGFLVTYNRTPEGKAYNIYEGRNFIGRDSSCDISVPDDNQMSGRHMSILYRNVDDKFKFRDEQSSNGTFVNSELLDDGELSNYDIIRAGSTIFVFIAIPNIN